MIALFEMPFSPPCKTVKILANLLGIQLSCIRVDTFKKQQLEPEYRKINPFHKIPTINDDGFYLFESKAIMLYLLNKYAPDSSLYPKDLQKRARVDEMLHLENGSTFPIMRRVLRPQIYLGLEPTVEDVENAKEHLSILDEVLAQRTFAAGDELTLADLSLGFTLNGFKFAGMDLPTYPKVAEYLDRLRSKLAPTFDEMNEAGDVELIESIRKNKAMKVQDVSGNTP